MKLISFKAPSSYIDAIDELVRIGVYSSRSEAIRVGIRDLVKRELNWMESKLPEDISEQINLETQKL